MVSFLVLALTMCVAFPVLPQPLPSGGRELASPELIARGEPGIVSMAMPGNGMAAGAFTLRIQYADGSSSPEYRGFETGTAHPASIQADIAALTASLKIPDRRIQFLISVPAEAPLGTALISVHQPDGTMSGSARFLVSSRAFIQEDLRLDKAMTTLRVVPDPRKTEQAVRYQALLARVDPDAAFFDGSFVMPVQTERRTSLFATRRRYLYSDGSSDVTLHNGIDYGCPVGTPVLAAGSGRVAMAEDRIVTGKTVVLEHLPGTYTIYMHLDSLAVSEGNLIKRGEPIGLTGMTGLATGPHLHWEFRVMGVACDPEAMVGLDKRPVLHTIPFAIEGR